MANSFVILDPHHRTGFFGGVDFHNGRGSTPSVHDAGKLLSAGCTIEGDEAAAFVKAHVIKAAEDKAATETKRKAEAAFDHVPRNPRLRRSRPGRT